MRVNVNWFKIFTVIGILESKLSKALEDGKIDFQEAMDLILTICSTLDIEVKKD
jgi:hypothetical protein